MISPKDDRPNTPRLVVTGTLLTVTSSLPAFMTGTLAVSIGRELSISPPGLGLAIGAYFLTMSLGSAPFGRSVQRIGWANGMRISGVVVAVALSWIGFGVRSLTGLVAALAVAGVSHAVGQPAVNWALSTHVDRGTQGIAFAIKQSSVPIAILLGGVAVPAIALTVGWRWGFRGAALLAVLQVLAVPRNTRDGLAPSIRNRAPTPQRPLILIGIAGAFGAAASASLAGFIVSSSVSSGLSESLAGKLVAIGSVLGIAIRLAIGLVTDRRRTDGMDLLAVLLSGGAAGLFLLAWGLPGLVVVAPVIAFAGAWGWQGAYVYAIVHRHRNFAAAATGFGQSAASAGAAVGPVVFGWIAEVKSYRLGWFVAGAWLVVSAGLAVRAGGQGPTTTMSGRSRT